VPVDNARFVIEFRRVSCIYRRAARSGPQDNWLGGLDIGRARRRRPDPIIDRNVLCCKVLADPVVKRS
jgi:hypothetical protein